MGRLEKQIIIGALALVGLLLSVVVFKGLKPRDAAEASPALFIPLEGEVGDLVAAPEKPNPHPLFPDVQAKPPRPAEASIAPKSKPKPEPRSAEPRLYTIRPNDTLSEIAQEQLGSLRFLSRILEANPGLDQDHLVPGETLVLPAGESLVAKEAALRPSTTANHTARTHTVQAGDSLWGLAEKYYGEGYRVDRIVEANPKLLPNKNTVLKIGWVLVIPE